MPDRVIGLSSSGKSWRLMVRTTRVVGVSSSYRVRAVAVSGSAGCGASRTGLSGGADQVGLGPVRRIM